MNTYTDLLPPTLTEQHAAIDWTPDGSGAGVLTIKKKRGGGTYRVSPIQTAWAGWGFRLTKLEGGTDPENAAYDVFIGHEPHDTLCPCKGYQRHQRCSHVAALATIMANGWLAARPDDFDGPGSNPDADVGPTEIHDQPEPEWVSEVGYGDEIEVIPEPPGVWHIEGESHAA